MILQEYKVLLIDDDKDDYFLIKDLLSEVKDSKYLLDWKNSFSDGLTALKTQNYDVCLLDHRLGEQTGLELLEQVKSKTLGIPFILLTGYGDLDLDLQAMQMGASDYLVKSQLSSQILERCLRYCLKHSFDLNELRQREQNFSTLLNSTFEGILVHKAGIIQQANRAAEEIFCTDFNGLVGQEVKALIDLQASMELKPVECPGMTKDGQRLNLEVLSRQITLNKKELSLIAVRDLTDRKNLEAQVLQQDRLASLGLLASSLAHEIGTPLGIIRSRAELIAMSNTSTRKDMDLIVSQIDRISKLVYSLLNIARGDQSHMTVDVDLAKVLEDVLALIRFELDRKNIDLEFDLQDQIMVRAEAAPLGQVFLNLLVNAIHATDEAKKKFDDSKSGKRHSLQVAARKLDDFIEVSVRDSGTGIAPEHLTQLFKPFFTTKDIGLGTGLGLATSYKILQSWGGTIRASNSPAGGACFTIQLRAAKEDR